MKTTLKSARFVPTIGMLAVLAFAAAPSAPAQSLETEGYASWYNRGAQGQRTANGESYDRAAMTAAHPSLPFDSMVRVTRLDTGRSIVVRINDRMTSGPGHIIDLSGAAAARLGLLDINVARVRIDVENPVDLVGNRVLLAENDHRAPSHAKAVPEAIADHSRFTLQVGVFSTRPAATKFADGLDDGWILEVSDSGESLYRVYYDRFSLEEPARVAQKRLKASGYDSFLREIAP